MAKSPKLEMKAKAIAALEDSKGNVRPVDVIEAARDPKSALHKDFEWDDTKAAHKHRLETARKLIREVKLVFKYEDVKIIAPYYVVDKTTEESRYSKTLTVAKNGSRAMETLTEEMVRIKNAIHRGITLATVFGLESKFHRMLEIALEAEVLISSHSDGVDRGDDDGEGTQPSA